MSLCRCTTHQGVASKGSSGLSCLESLSPLVSVNMRSDMFCCLPVINRGSHSVFFFQEGELNLPYVQVYQSQQELPCNWVCNEGVRG